MAKAAAEERSDEEIWADDLFGRKEEAALLQSYIESIATHGAFLARESSYTIAVDAGYGEGKSFFLRRLAEQMKRNHPVAFVDAWVDDLADEPLTAVAATLKKALEPAISTENKLGRTYRAAMGSLGQIAKATAGGAMRKAAETLITKAGVAAVEGAISDSLDEAVEKGSESGVGKATEGLSGKLTPTALMDERIKNFEKGQKAVEKLKSDLRRLVSGLDGTDYHKPIVIVIDELDRCRPTYAVKLLEHIKHLFDIPGIVFILGINQAQLSHSVAGVYGSNFDGYGYLNRFINRHYRLRRPDLSPLVQMLMQNAGFDVTQFAMPEVKLTGNENEPFGNVSPATMVVRYLSGYDAAPRDVFYIIDRLHTAFSLVDGSHLLLPLILHLILSEYFKGRTANIKMKFAGNYRTVGGYEDLSPDHYHQQIMKMALQTPQYIAERYGDNDHAAMTVKHLNQTPRELAKPVNYGKLISAVGRMSSFMAAGPAN